MKSDHFGSLVNQTATFKKTTTVFNNSISLPRYCFALFPAGGMFCNSALSGNRMLSVLYYSDCSRKYFLKYLRKISEHLSYDAPWSPCYIISKLNKAGDSFPLSSGLGNLCSPRCGWKQLPWPFGPAAQADGSCSPTTSGGLHFVHHYPSLIISQVQDLHLP